MLLHRKPVERRGSGQSTTGGPTTYLRDTGRVGGCRGCRACLAPTRTEHEGEDWGACQRCASLPLERPLADVKLSKCYDDFSRGRTIMFNLKKIGLTGVKLFILWHAVNFIVGLFLAVFVFVPAMIQ